MLAALASNMLTTDRFDSKKGRGIKLTYNHLSNFQSHFLLNMPLIGLNSYKDLLNKLISYFV
jgi:hypothetical protein